MYAFLSCSPNNRILASGATSIHLQSIVIFLGVSNGIFSIAAIGLMMQLAKEGGKRKEGIRMGLWGASQAIAFALGSHGHCF